MVELYSYSKCSNCQKARKILKENGVAFREIDIITQPPSKALLKKIVHSGQYSIQDLFNRSGEVYRQFNMKEKINNLTNDALFELLSQYGKLIKRPVINCGQKFVVGFDFDRINEIK